MFWTAYLLAALVASAAAQVKFMGVAIAGGDFGCQTDGTCPTGSTQLALGSSGGDGPGQMQHWTSLSPKPLNLFRLPISWQFLVNNQVGSTLDSTNLGKYDQLVQACLKTGAHCMIDIHNFARFNGGIIGQGGPTDDQFVSLWTQLATKYANQSEMVFELMNEPHDLDINLWAATCQKTVAAIRGAGATSQMILLPGTNFDSAATLVSSGSAAAMMNITNPDGSTDNLVLDIHKYLDTDNSGTHTTCTTNNIDAFTTVAQFLRQAGRKGLISESGASSDSTCLTDFCAQNTFINQNADVFMGFVGWGAGSFDTSYVLSLTPSKQNNQLVDNQVMQQCVINIWNSVTGSASSSAAAVATTKPAASQQTVSITPIVTATVNPVTTASLSGTAGTGTPTTGTLTLTLSGVTDTGSGGGGLITAPGSPTVPARTTQGTVAASASASASASETGLLVASGSPNMTASGRTTASSTSGVAISGGSTGILTPSDLLVVVVMSLSMMLSVFAL